MAASTLSSSSSSLQRTCFQPQTPIARHCDSIPRPRPTKNVVLGKSNLEFFSRQALQIKRQEGGQVGKWRRNQGINVRAAKRIDRSRSFLLSTTLVAKEEEEHKVAELCQSITQWAKEKQNDRSSGIQEFGCFSDLYRKHTYHFMERYRSFQHIVDIRSLPEHTKFMTDVRPLLTQPVQLAVYEYQDGKIGQMLNPIGPKGEGGLDDATGQGGSGGGVSHKQQSKISLNLESEEKKDKGEWSLKKALEMVRGENKQESNGEKSGQWNIASLFGKSEN